MSLNAEQLAKIATLSRLKLDENQIEALQGPINNIMNLADTLSQQDTEGIEPLSHPIAMIQEVSLALRVDEVTESDDRTNNMVNAPASQNGLFLVPKVID
jgi:aspartyl-tRNA(Asn)/glutamyl-tRNA(Gln) amidotransferase subunit C